MSDAPNHPPDADDEIFDRIVAAVADGTPVDWASAEERVSSSDQRNRLQQLRLLAEFASAAGAPDQSLDASAVASRTPLQPAALPRLPDDSRFVLEECLGQGGFGVVYRAFDRVQQMQVALKAFTRAGVDSVYTFKREFRVLADLTHPNLVSLYELFADDHSWFIAMELVPGVDFLTYVRHRGEEGMPGVEPPAAAALRCDLQRLGAAMTQLCEAIAYLHSEDKLHCDIKPSNVLITESGHVKVVDFGLATDVSTAWTDPSVGIRGTPAYLAPEQAGGRSPSGASDWYGVGVMLFEALTGARPFTGTVTQVLEAKQRQVPPSARRIAGVPEALAALCDRLLELDPAARPSDTQVLEAVAAIWPNTGVSRVVKALREHGPFVGRGHELELLEEGLSRAASGPLQAVFLQGASGMGKSFLVRRFIETVQHRQPGTVILEGRCSERESVPYKGLDSLVDRLTQYLRSLPYEEVLAVLPRDSAALGRLFPILRQIDAVELARRSARLKDARELRRRGGLAFLELLTRLAERNRLVLVIDDLHWTDTDSATLLNEVLFESAAPSLLFVGCYRTEEAASSGPLQALLSAAAASQRDGRCALTTASLGELAAAEARELALALARRDGTDPPIDAIVEESGRSPLFIHQLMQYSATGSLSGAAAIDRVGDASPEPLTLETVICARTASFGDRARRLLEVLAVFGGPLDLGIAGEVAGLGPVPLNESVVLRTARLARSRLTGVDQKLEVYHDRIREAIVSDIEPAALKNLHWRMATALERVADADAEALVHHFQRAGEPQRAATYAVVAGNRAADALAFDRAARSYRFALDFGRFDDAGRDVYTRLGDALAASGRGSDAAHAYLDAARTDSGERVIELKRRASEQLLQSGHLDEGMVVVEDVLRRAGLRLPATPRQALLSLLVLRMRILARGLGFKERPERDIRSDELVAVDTCWSVTTGLAIVDHIRSAEFGARHLLLALGVGEPLRIVRALTMELAYTSITGAKSQPRNDRLVAIAEPLAARLPNPEARALLVLGRGSAAYMQGQWTMSRELCEQATHILRDQCTRVAWHTDTAQFYTLLSLLYLGEIAELSRRLPGLLKDARDREAVYAETIVRTRLGYLACLAGDDVTAAEQMTREGMERWSQRGFHNQHYYEMVAVVERELYAGRGTAARASVDRRWSDFARTLLLRVQPVLIESLHLRARAALACAFDPATASADRIALLHRSEKDAKRIQVTGAPWARGLGHLILAGTCSLRNARSQAADHLAAAEAMFEREHMGMYLAATRLRRGQLQGGADGDTCAAAACAAMQAQSIHNPEAFARMLAPGDFRSPSHSAES